MSYGRFITLEGGEGAGKSTQVARLAQKLEVAGHEVIVTREPGGTPFAEAIRHLLLDPLTPEHTPVAEALLFYAARTDHMERLIAPALDRGTWVLCDRFSDSTRAYQGAAGGVDDKLLTQLEALVIGARKPHLTLILDIDPALGLERAAARALANGTPPADPYESRGPAFHARLRDAFRAIAAAEPDRCAIVDAAAPSEMVAEVIWQVVCDRLQPGA